MAKKASRKKGSQTSAKETGTVPFQVRFDPDLHAKLKDAAEEAGISLNQLIQGMCRGCCDYLVQGEPEVTREGFVEVEPRQGCVFFGRGGYYMSEEDRQTFINAGRGDELGDNDNGVLWFGLDFTNRGVVRHEPRV